MNLDAAYTLARGLMDSHGLQGWPFRFNQKRRQFGTAYFTPPRLEMSRTLVELNDEARVRNTILHEIAHALAWIRHRDRSHGPVWRAVAVSIGCDGARLCGNEVVRPPAPWISRCAACGREGRAYRRRRRAACRRCCQEHNGGVYDARFLVEYRGA